MGLKAMWKDNCNPVFFCNDIDSEKDIEWEYTAVENLRDQFFWIYF